MQRTCTRDPHAVRLHAFTSPARSTPVHVEAAQNLTAAASDDSHQQLQQLGFG